MLAVQNSKTQKHKIKEYSPYYSFVLEITQTNTKGNIIPNRFSLYKTIINTNAKHLINPQVYKGPTSIGPHQFTISRLYGVAYLSRPS